MAHARDPNRLLLTGENDEAGVPVPPGDGGAPIGVGNRGAASASTACCMASSTVCRPKGISA